MTSARVLDETFVILIFYPSIFSPIVKPGMSETIPKQQRAHEFDKSARRHQVQTGAAGG